MEEWQRIRHDALARHTPITKQNKILIASSRLELIYYKWRSIAIASVIDLYDDLTENMNSKYSPLRECVRNVFSVQPTIDQRIWKSFHDLVVVSPLREGTNTNETLSTSVEGEGEGGCLINRVHIASVWMHFHFPTEIRARNTLMRERAIRKWKRPTEAKLSCWISAVLQSQADASCNFSRSQILVRKLSS